MSNNNDTFPCQTCGAAVVEMANHFGGRVICEPRYYIGKNNRKHTYHGTHVCASSVERAYRIARREA